MGGNWEFRLSGGRGLFIGCMSRNWEGPAIPAGRDANWQPGTSFQSPAARGLEKREGVIAGMTEILIHYPNKAVLPWKFSSKGE